VDAPLILYNIPGRTGVDIDTETVLRLSGIANVVGLKDATGDIGRVARLLRQAPDGFTLYSGDDRTAAAMMLLGARGVISVAANVMPRAVSDLCRAALSGNIDQTRRLSRLLSPLFDALGAESNPIPVKHLLAGLGRCGGHLRLPLTPLSDGLHSHVEAALAEVEQGLQEPSA